MIKVKNIKLTGSNGLPVLLDLFFEDKYHKRPVVIYSHGFNGFKDWGNFDLIAERFAAAGFLFVKFNFSHNGTTIQEPEAFENLEAFGQNNYTKQLADLKMVTDWICNEKNPYNDAIDNSLVYLLGHSMGGGISILFAAEDKRIKKIIGWASISECKTPWGSWPEEKIAGWKKKGVEYYLNGRTMQQMPLYYQLYEDYEQNRQRLDIRKAISRLTIPVLLCHGTLDPAVPVEAALQLQQWKPDSQLFTVESDHVFGRKQPWTEGHLPKPMEEVVTKSISFLLSAIS